MIFQKLRDLAHKRHIAEKRLLGGENNYVEENDLKQKKGANL